MIYAQIKNNRISNVIVLNDISMEPLFLEGYDYLLRIDALIPQPQIDWIYSPEETAFYNMAEFDKSVQQVDAEILDDIAISNVDDAATIDVDSVAAPEAVKTIWRRMLNALLGR